MLNVGERAPDFELANELGRPFHLADETRSGPLVLYFYPADFTRVCSREAAMFRDEHHELARCGLRVYGVSPQTCECHGRFREHLALPFHLLSDPEKKVAALYDAVGWFGMVRRITYLIGRNGLIQDRVHAAFRLVDHRALIRRALAMAR